jgi:hypothetical protein
MPHAPEYIPTPDEIKTACRRIQARWSENERRARIVDDSTRWQNLGMVRLPTVIAVPEAHRRGRTVYSSSDG